MGSSDVVFASNYCGDCCLLPCLIVKYERHQNVVFTLRLWVSFRDSPYQPSIDRKEKPLYQTGTPRHAFTFSRIECWVSFRDSPPPSHRSTKRGALGLRGAPLGSAPTHYLRTQTGHVGKRSRKGGGRNRFRGITFSRFHA